MLFTILQRYGNAISDDDSTATRCFLRQTSERPVSNEDA